MKNNYELEILNNSNIILWNDFFDQYNGLVTIAHNPTLSKILKKSFGFDSKNIMIKQSDKIIGVFPISIINGKLVSIPHFSYGDILLNGSETEKKKIRDKILNKQYEIRSFEAFSAYYNDLKIMSYLELKDSVEDQWNYWKSKLRSQIRKGIKNGVQVKKGRKEYLTEFYRVYSKNMRDIGSPVLSYKFFKNILEFYQHGEAKVFLAEYQNKTIASSIVLTYKDFAEVCWASSLKEFNNTQANMVIYWEMIKHAVNQNYDIFSFGRSSKDSNTYRFKKQWNPKEKQLYFNYSHPQKISIKKMTFLSKLWSKLPLFIANLIGPYISKRIY
ncbi:MAG: GNAT family N-acetyltransferase [archaeon]